jgi:undecaprenyl-diphosphatase
MSTIDAVILGIIQGITEFLPISSTAHLTLAGKLMGLIRPDAPGEWTATIAIIQLGTAASILVYFRQEIISMTRSLVADLGDLPKARRVGFRPDSRLAFLISAGTVPIVVLGLLLKRVIESNLTKDPAVIAWSLICLALILFWAERAGRRTRTLEEKTMKDAVLVGLAQAVALIPGASRSGTTITAGLFLGFTREAAARFSFLLSIPAVIASGLYQLYEVREHLSASDVGFLVVSVVTSAVTGYLAIAFLLRYLKNHSTMVFIAYRILLGLGLLLLLSRA